MERVQTHMKYGLLTGIAMIVLGLILHVTGQSFQTWSQYVTYIPLLAGLILNAQAFAKANNHFVTFGNVFSSGFKACAIVTLIMLAWGVISLYIFPDMREKAMEIAEKSMAQRGMSDEQIQEALEMTKKFFIPFMMGGILFSTMFYGAILSLIAAAIPKKMGNNQTPFDNNTSSEQFQH